MSKSNTEKKLAIGAGRVVAVAIENNKTSQYAAKWAVDNLVPKDQCLLLIHVRQRPSSIPTPCMDANDDVARAYKQQADNESNELFASFRVFCNRKSIQCKELLLEDMDICKALIESVTAYSIELLVLGAPSRSGLVRRFKAADVPSTVSKGAPPFCTVYIISKGKISTVRSATVQLSSSKPATTPAAAPAPAPTRNQLQAQDRMDTQVARNHPPRPSSERPAAYGTRQVLDDIDDIISPFTRSGRSYESSIPADSDISFVSSGRPSVDRLFPSVYDDLDAGMGPRVSCGSDYDGGRSSFGSSFSAGTKSFDMADFSSFTSQGSGISSSRISISDINNNNNNMDDMEVEMRRLKLELKQTMEMYSSACKEALTAKQKAMELQRWKLEEQKKLEEVRVAEEAALTLVEREKEKYRAAMKAAEASQRIAELEGQKRMSAGISKNNNNNNNNNNNRGGGGHSFGNARYRRYTIEEIEEATKNFSESLKIGEGGYGPVYRSELDHTPVAIKVLKSDAAQGRAQFQQEVEVLSCIRHPNMVLLLGACPEYGCLVYEHMSRGSLDDCLFRRGNTPPLPWQLRFQIAAEIATGLLFLHQTKPEPLVHRDLKPANILLDRNYVSKISDVGLARLVPPTVADTVTQYRMTSTAGTFCYIDPEYQQTGMLGIKSDVYSLGVMLLQMITAKPPMGLTHHVGRAIEKGTFLDMLDPAVEDWPLDRALHFAKLALQCAEMRRKDRPDLGKVVLPELNKLRTFAQENMPMMIFGAYTGFTPRTSNASSLPSTISTSQESRSMSGISGYESRSSTGENII